MANLYERGSIVLVPFPFTDLSQSKQRPAVVISPSNFSGDNIIVCAVSSRASSTLKSWEIILIPDDTENKRLPKESVVKVDRLFTIHHSRVIKVLDKLNSGKSNEVMNMLKQLLS
jgi:mRNA interferase MazF